MIYQLLPESPKSGPNHRRRFGSKVYCVAITSIVLYVVFVVLTGKAAETNRDGTIGSLNDSTAKDVSSSLVTDQSNQVLGHVENIVLLGERHSGTNWITVSSVTASCLPIAVCRSLSIYITLATFAGLFWLQHRGEQLLSLCSIQLVHLLIHTHVHINVRSRHTTRDSNTGFKGKSCTKGHPIQL